MARLMGANDARVAVKVNDAFGGRFAVMVFAGAFADPHNVGSPLNGP